MQECVMMVGEGLEVESCSNCCTLKAAITVFSFYLQAHVSRCNFLAILHDLFIVGR